MTTDQQRMPYRIEAIDRNWPAKTERQIVARVLSEECGHDETLAWAMAERAASEHDCDFLLAHDDYAVPLARFRYDATNMEVEAKVLHDY